MSLPIFSVVIVIDENLMKKVDIIEKKRWSLMVESQNCESVIKYLLWSL